MPRGWRPGGDIYHDRNLGRSVTGWETVGENVGVTSATAAAAGRLHEAFMESPSHRRNLLDQRFTEYGFAAVVSGPDVYVVQRFRQPIERTSSPVVASPPASGAAPSDSTATAAQPTAPAIAVDTTDSAIGPPPQPTPDVVVLGARLDLLDPAPNDHPLRKALPPLLLLVAFALLLWNVASVAFLVGRRGTTAPR